MISSALGTVNSWSRHHSACRNCGTGRHPHRGRGYCTRCYRLIRKIEQAEKWSLSDSATLPNWPWAYLIHDEARFERIRQDYILQIKERLQFLQIREVKLFNPIDGLSIEYELRSIARRAGIRDHGIFHSTASVFDEQFDLDQKNILFRLLNRIQEGIPWNGIDYYRLFSA